MPVGLKPADVPTVLADDPSGLPAQSHSYTCYNPSWSKTAARTVVERYESCLRSCLHSYLKVGFVAVDKLDGSCLWLEWESNTDVLDSVGDCCTLVPFGGIPAVGCLQRCCTRSSCRFETLRLGGLGVDILAEGHNVRSFEQDLLIAASVGSFGQLVAYTAVQQVCAVDTGAEIAAHIAAVAAQGELGVDKLEFHNSRPDGTGHLRQALDFDKRVLWPEVAAYYL